MQFTRRVKRVDVDPPEEYCSIASACYCTGISHASLTKALDTGRFCCGIWESIDKSGIIKCKADGVEYRSLSQAAIAIGCNRGTFTRYLKKKLKKFTVKGHLIEIL